MISVLSVVKGEVIVFSNADLRSVQSVEVLLIYSDVIDVLTTIVRTMYQLLFYVEDDNPRK